MKDYQAIRLHMQDNTHIIETIENFMKNNKGADEKECKKNIQILEEVNKALSEIQQYRAIGTVEECRAAVEKQRAKKPIMKTDDGIESISGLSPYCPFCGCELTDRIPFDNKDFYFHCLNCGQRFDWSDTT